MKKNHLFVMMQITNIFYIADKKKCKRTKNLLKSNFFPQTIESFANI